MPPPEHKPRNYFLNESHELSVVEKTGGGKQMPYPKINWTTKSKALHGSLEKVTRRAAQSRDPLATRKYYLLADPASEIVRASTAKNAVDGLAPPEAVQFSGEQSKLIGRIGLDLIDVHPSGAATVHATPERMEELLTSTQHLAELGLRYQTRFVAFESFEWLPGKLKFDDEWLDELRAKPGEGLIHLQPLITELEADLVIRAVDAFLRGKPGLRLIGKGRSYLGRFFLRASLNASSIKQLADEFTSIQSLHAPIVALAGALPPSIGGGVSASSVKGTSSVATRLPCVGVVDTAIPEDHEWLTRYRRGNASLGQSCASASTDHHGSIVATRVVYGDVDLSGENDLPKASCRFFEVRVGNGQARRIRTESVANAIANSLVQAPDLRVFTLSFDSEIRLEGMPDTQRRETLRVIEELDNLAFDRDILLIFAAGNAPSGVVPSPPYPLHFDNPAWQLNAYPRAFNALTCGGIARRLAAGGLVPEMDAPSPFTRIGPDKAELGFSGSPKPDFCESAGDAGPDYALIAGGGVWGLDANGMAKETAGTSFAAPLLAREAAFVFEELSTKCPGEAIPFACTVKAVLAMTADEVTSRLDASLQPLAKRTTGFGIARADYFKKPAVQKARFVWQGVIQHEDDIVRVQVPVPISWIAEARAPWLRVCVAWDTPVCAAAEAQWSCRDMEITVCPGPDADYMTGSHRKVAGYPLFVRRWNLAKAREKGVLDGDLWTVKLKYLIKAAYTAGHPVPPSQRVAFVGELWDDADAPVNPHRHVQSLPIASTLVRLSNTSAWLPQPVAITSQV